MQLVLGEPVGSWAAADAYAQDKICQEHRSTGSCHCRSRKGKKGKQTHFNPCDRAENIRESIAQVSMGLIAKHTLGEITEWFRKHRCRDLGCRHPGCVRADAIIDFLHSRKRIAA